MRVFAALVALACPLLAQGFSLPFSVTGGPLHVEGTLTSGPPVVCAGTVTIGGMSGSIGPCKPRYNDGGVYCYRMQVEINEDLYIIWISVNTQGQIGNQVGGYWYIAGMPQTTWFH